MIELGGVLPEGDWTVEELFRCYGEEFCLISCAVSVKEGLVAFFGEAAQPQEFPGADGHPFGELGATGEGRGAVGSTVEHVELVGELVVDHVMSLLRVARTVQDAVPHEDNRPLGQSLADDGDRRRQRAIHAFEYPGVVLGRHHG